MNGSVYKSPESDVLNYEDVKYKNKLIYVLLLLMFFSKFFVVYLLFAYVLPSLEGRQVNVVYSQLIHQYAYFFISLLCVIGLLFRVKLAYFIFLVSFLVNLAIYIVLGTSVYQSIYDPILLLVFTLLVIYIKPNIWREKFVK